LRCARFCGVSTRTSRTAERLQYQAEELAQVGDALRESETRLLDFALTSSDWFWETDSEYRLTFASDGIRLVGIDPESCVGRTHWELDLDAATEPKNGTTTSRLCSIGSFFEMSDIRASMTRLAPHICIQRQTRF